MDQYLPPRQLPAVTETPQEGKGYKRVVEICIADI